MGPSPARTSVTALPSFSSVTLAMADTALPQVMT